MYERDVATGIERLYYQFNGQTVALRDNGILTFVYGDHLGSISLAIRGDGAVSQQDFTPWGEVRSGGISATTLNYTGQPRDGTGLLNYNARMYDPALSRFISADSVVPGAADGSLDGVALKPLTVALAEPDLITRVNQENRQPFWFQRDDDAQVAPWGPANAQALNRYAYVQNNPLKYTDPTGHETPCYEVGCSNIVKNESKGPVEIIGERRKEGCQWNIQECFERVIVELQLGESSADYGLTDVDFILPLDEYKINGNGSDQMYKLADYEDASVKDDGTGKGAIIATDCRSGWNVCAIDGYFRGTWRPVNKIRESARRLGPEDRLDRGKGGSR